jgi:ACS family hexuronate transporter-like MFS transporter
LGNAGVLLSSLVIGALVSKIGYSPFFVSLVVLDLIGAIVLWTVVQPPERKAVVG